MGAKRIDIVLAIMDKTAEKEIAEKLQLMDIYLEKLHKALQEGDRLGAIVCKLKLDSIRQRLVALEYFDMGSKSRETVPS